MKHLLILKQTGPFSCSPRFAGLEGSEILCNNVVLPEESNPHNVRLWAIGNEYGPICALWAECEQGALDEIMAQGKGDSFLVSPEDHAAASEEEREEWPRLGDAGEPCDLSHAWIAPVELEPARDWEFLCRLAEARGQNSDTL